ncbi:nuclear transport factor 2 family protein [Lysobacter arenosi]|uniref:Nuclear transport factor 2 family protein n=1 Tax=Lysobacter arenosi TaxID=2795387 RepID=A0ABX7RA66_9GAMM|nr:nuclear transport factor 2 family protein [Lysobacter arenosi]QSX73874.1 nuclear transport factor 2 family protein [Lysobacter arenosi]
MNVQHNPEIVRFIDLLAETGSHYRIEEMQALYTEDLGFLVVTPQGGVARFSKDEILGEFRDRRDAGDAPLSTERRILHIEEQQDLATVLLYRRMSHEADPALYELRLRKVDGEWRVAGETVSPWPDLTMARGFLPPRK